MDTTKRLAAFLLGTGFASLASAHHGLANFDLNTDITVEGTIADIALINPHSWIYVDVPMPMAVQANGNVNCAAARYCAVPAGQRRCSRSAHR
jgi:hypothetical protein